MPRSLIFLFFFSLNHLLYSQCPTGDVYLNSQSDVEDFITNYGTCEVITGTVYIGDAADISGVTAIKRIEGSLRISYSEITSVSNFSNLEFVGGDFIIDQSHLIETIEGINKLQTVNGDFLITQNYSGLKHIKGFNALEKIGGNFQVSENYSLETISTFDNLRNVDGWFLIRRANAMEKLEGFNNLVRIGVLTNPIWLSEGNLNITDNNSLIEINGFRSLIEIAQSLDITTNSKLEKIIGFDSLEKVNYQINIGGYFSGSPLLTEIPMFDNLITIGSGMEIRQTGLTNIIGFNNVQVIGDLDPSWGNLYIHNNDNLLEITGFEGLTKLEGALDIGQNNKLINLQGFRNLIELRTLGIGNNPLLPNLIGLEGVFILDAPGGTAISIGGNQSLTDCSVLCNLLTNGIINGEIFISDNPSKCSSEKEVREECIPDFDKDGILNDDDLDDDNDGILDTVEQNGDPNRDSDNDNYPDHQDLDSDNDRCFDVIEAGFTDNDQNGTLGSLPDGVDINGLIIGEPDGYTIPLDNNSDGVFDFQQVNILNAGEDGNLEICINSTSVDLFDSLAGTPDTGGVWAPSLTSGTGMFDPSIDTAGIYTYTVTNGVCGSDTSEVNVTVDVIPNAGEDGNLEICINSTSVDLFDSLAGTPDTGGVWAPSLTSGTGMFDPSIDTAGIYTYTVSNGVCGSDTSEVDVTIDTLPNAGEDGNLEICINSTSVDLFDSLAGTPDTGGIWTPSLTSGTGMFDPSIDTAGIYTYTVTNGVCGSDTSEVDVSVEVLPNAGENGSLEICINSSSVNLFDSLAGTPDTGGVWTPSLISGTGVFDPSVDVAGVYTYTVNNGVCGSDTSEVNVTITNVTPISDYEIKIKEFSSNNSLEVLINSNLEYEYSLDGINYQSGNTFNNLAGGDYTVYVQEVNGCGILETMTSILDYPKFFTPNNDGFNDTWKLKGRTDRNYSIFIYDRYGKLLKNLTSPESSWDGTFNGNQLPTNDYWFKVVFIDGTVKSGHFTLKR